LKCLPKQKHLSTISKFAQLEFKFGSPEKGRTIFETLLGNYPKRVDMWLIYLDLEIKAGQQDIIKHLFERVISLNLSAKKMNSLFKKYLLYEKKYGTPESIEHVKQKAREYVESKS